MRTFAAAIVMCALFAVPDARAQGNAVVAESLFREGRTLMSQGQHAAACPKLEESQRLDPGGGTLILLASCHEAIGKIATAWSEYREAVTWSKRDNRNDRAAVAQGRIDALEPRLPYLVVDVDQAARVPGLEVTRDGTVLAPVAWGTKIPIDLGDHVVEARAPGYQTLSIKRTVKAEATTESIHIPSLTRVPETPPPQPVKREEPVKPPKDEPSSGSGFRTVGFALSGVGIVLLGVGTFFGISSVITTSQVRDRCDPRKCGDAEGIRLHDEALRDANISNVTLAAGGVSLVVGAILILSSPSSRPSRALGNFGTITF